MILVVKLQLESSIRCISKSSIRCIGIGIGSGSGSGSGSINLNTRQIYQLNNKLQIKINSIKKEMMTWTFPLHFIDFETSSPPLPYFKADKPYDIIPFQFSHHVMYR